MKLIQTTNYLLLIDEEAEIKEDDYLFDKLTSNYAGIHQHSGVEYENGNKPNIIQCKSGTTSPISCSSKVIAYHPLTKEAKELDLSLLPNPFEEEIDENIVRQHLSSLDCTKEEGYVFTYAGYIWKAFEAGYKAAQSKRFSLEDMKKAIEMSHAACRRDIPFSEDLKEEIIQSLSTQQLPKEFIPEYEEYFDQDSELGDDWGHKSIKKRLKTTTNSKGKGELVGEYRY